ncbi:hypothetical protein FRB93_010384 [Tulasnella sp. JGI-2019a]|nr:hypothetical protein FRB93_010384 [Tulasnella sp. JGI-2019a]
MYDIENEIIYPSRPGFAFHDSRGIESGSMDKVAEFFSRRAKLSLKDRVHVAWICFPLSNAQPLGEAERCMPQLGPNPGESRHPELSVKTSLMLATVPAVVVFTEYNGLEATVLNNLRYEGRLSMREAFRAMSDATEHLFKEQWLNRIYTSELPKPPFVRLKDLHKPEGECQELMTCTADVLKDNKPAQKLLSLHKSMNWNRGLNMLLMSQSRHIQHHEVRS